MHNLTQTKETLIRFYEHANFDNFKHLKKLADDYELPRQKSFTAYRLGEKLFNKQKMHTEAYLDKEYNQ